MSLFAQTNENPAQVMKTGIHRCQWMPVLTTYSNVLISHIDSKGND